MTIVWVINFFWNSKISLKNDHSTRSARPQAKKDTRFWRDNNWILNYDTLEINFLDCMLGVLRDFFN
jgi:hypothetical protein